ncbi:MAG: sigma-54-dependent Fis family transcriptional regulator [Myxococcales bacterium]|nr:sigma-54-dependent Fis family transcriptional regulator [Myxococcales bacterium]
MQSIRSVLWLGKGERFAADLVEQAPLLDVVWQNDLAELTPSHLERFDAIVFDTANASTAAPDLRRLAARDEMPPVIARIDADQAAHEGALRRAGAVDVWLRDRDAPTRLLERLDLAVRGGTRHGVAAPRDRLTGESPSPEIVGKSPAMREVFALLDRAQKTRASVLLSGETGTGKEVLAHAIHEGACAAGRRGGAFVAVNCAAFPDTLLESELFGHVRGSFTGADRDKKGLFETANDGTIFLDEIGETTPSFQAKLLRALQEREVRPVGATHPKRVDVRVIAATNRDLQREIARGAFREDLYYRIAVFPITLPPLRRRTRDILPLARHFIARHCAEENLAPRALSAKAANLLRAYPWPGNVRELDNEMQRALALCDSDPEIRPEHLSPRLVHALAPIENNLRPGDSLRATVDRIEAWLICEALQTNGGRRAETARKLHLTREGLYKKMKRLGIQ